MIFFDLDETLLMHDAACREAVAGFHQRFKSETDLDVAGFTDRWEALTDEWYDKYLDGQVSYQGQRRKRLQALFPRLDDAQADERFAVYLAGYESHWRLFPDVLPALEALASHGLGVITNGDARQQQAKLDRTGVTQRVHVIAISGALNLRKPDARIFHEACRMGNADPAASWHVGDRLKDDAQGATAAGLTGVWLCRDGAVPADPAIPTIRSLAELPELIGKGRT